MAPRIDLTCSTSSGLRLPKRSSRTLAGARVVIFVVMMRMGVRRARSDDTDVGDGRRHA